MPNKTKAERLQCPNWIWEGIGPDGVKIPDSDIYKDKANELAYIDERGLLIGQLVAKIEAGDESAETELGVLIADQLLKYVEPKI